MKVFKVMSLVVVALTLSAHAWSQETVESVKKELSEKWAALNSFSGTVELQMNMKRGETKITATGNGSVECLKKGGVDMVRTEMEVDTAADGAGPEGGKSTKTKQLRIFDGTITFTEMDMNGQKRVIKTARTQSALTGGGKALFDQLEKNYSLSLLANEKVADRIAYVIQADPKPDSPQKGKNVRFYLDKQTGAMLKSIIMDEAGVPQLTTTVKDIKVNPQISEDQFKYTPPAGVEVIDADATKQVGANPHGAATAPAPAAPAAPATPATK